MYVENGIQITVYNDSNCVWEGKIIEEGTPSEIRESKKREVVRFLDDARLPFRGWTWD